MTNEIEKEYNNLSKKFKLPKFKEMDKEFEISTLESTSFLAKNILRKIVEKLEFYSDLIDRVIHPDPSSLNNISEIKAFSDSEKNNMYILYKKLMKSNRNIIELILDNDEKKQTEFLNKFLNEWLNIKIDLKNYISKMKESWEKETTIEQDLGYFG